MKRWSIILQYGAFPVSPEIPLWKHSLIRGEPGTANQSLTFWVLACQGTRDWPVHQMTYGVGGLPVRCGTSLFVPSLEEDGYLEIIILMSIYYVEVIKYYIPLWYKCYSWRTASKRRQERVWKKNEFRAGEIKAQNLAAPFYPRYGTYPQET